MIFSIAGEDIIKSGRCIIYYPSISLNIRRIFRMLINYNMSYKIYIRKELTNVTKANLTQSVGLSEINLAINGILNL